MNTAADEKTLLQQQAINDRKRYILDNSDLTELEVNELMFMFEGDRIIINGHKNILDRLPTNQIN